MSSKCPRCGKTVYFAERVQALGKDYHKLCLKCSACDKKVEPGGFCDNNGTLLCKTCYGQKAGPKGYGFGNSLDSHTRGATENN